MHKADVETSAVLSGCFTGQVHSHSIEGGTLNYNIDAIIKPTATPHFDYSNTSTSHFRSMV